MPDVLEMDMNDRSNESGPRQFSLFSSLAQPEAEGGTSLPAKRSVASGKIVWFDPNQLVDHPLNTELFGWERLTNVDDLIMALELGYDASRPIKCVKRQDGSLTIIDGHRRKRAAEIMNCRVPVVIQFLESETDELEEMILSNLVRNRSHRTCGIGTAVRVIQRIKPRLVKRGRPAKKNQALGARISEAGERADSKAAQAIDETNQVESSGGETRRAYYANLLGISEKKFRLVDYVLEHGNDDEKRELDFGPRKLNVIYKAVQLRITGEEEENGQDPRVVARRARAALRTSLSLFSLISTESHSEEIEVGIKSLAQLAKSEFTGEKPKGSTTAYVLKLYRKLLPQNLRGTKIAKP